MTHSPNHPRAAVLPSGYVDLDGAEIRQSVEAAQRQILEASRRYLCMGKCL